MVYMGENMCENSDEGILSWLFLPMPLDGLSEVSKAVADKFDEKLEKLDSLMLRETRPFNPTVVDELFALLDSLVEKDFAAKFVETLTNDELRGFAESVIAMHIDSKKSELYALLEVKNHITLLIGRDPFDEEN
jgi:hypothetical protein